MGDLRGGGVGFNGHIQVKKTFDNKLDIHWIIIQTLISSIVLIQESDGHQCLWLDSRDPDSSTHDQVFWIFDSYDGENNFTII